MSEPAAVAPAVSRHLARMIPPYTGADHVSLSCSCGYATDWFPLRYEMFPTSQMREHLADVHGAELGAGRCVECGMPTDYLRAGGIYLCATHAPTPTQWQIATEARGHDR